MSPKTRCRICGRENVHFEMNQHAPTDNICERCKEAGQAWVDYGQALCKAFNFRQGNITANQLFEALQGNDDDLARFISYVKDKTRELKDAQEL